MLLVFAVTLLTFLGFLRFFSSYFLWWDKVRSLCASFKFSFLFDRMFWMLTWICLPSCGCSANDGFLVNLVWKNYLLGLCAFWWFWLFWWFLICLKLMTALPLVSMLSLLSGIKLFLGLFGEISTYLWKGRFFFYREWTSDYYDCWIQKRFWDCWCSSFCAFPPKG
jgi:hypothetical protein